MDKQTQQPFFAGGTIDPVSNNCLDTIEGYDDLNLELMSNRRGSAW